MVAECIMDHSNTPSSGFLGFNFVARRLQKADGDGISVISNASATSGSMLGKVIAHDLSSVLSEDDEQNESTTTIPYSNEFVVQCKDDEMVYVTAYDGKRILKRCRPLRELLEECYRQGNGQVLYQPRWTPANVRRLVELLLHGRTWIENDAAIFQSFQNAAEELSLDIRLTSLINFQDSLSAPSTREFFKLANDEHYQFKLSAAIKSTQWLSLLDSGILLLSKCKLLSLNLSWNTDPLTAHEIPTQERLDRCDRLQSDFSVYGHSNMQGVFGIMNLLAPSKRENKKKTRQLMQEEPEIKVICKVRVGSLKLSDLAMVWRMTDCSFTVTSTEDQAYLEYFHREDSNPPTVNSKSPSFDKEFKIDLCHNKDSIEPSETTDMSSSSSTSDTVCVPKGIEIGESSSTNTSLETPQIATTGVSCSHEYAYRTLSGHSFLALQHILESIHGNTELDSAACLVVRAPTPDTLGRMINAAIHTSIPRLDFELRNESSTQGTVATFYACKSTREIQNMLEYLADYSSSAVVKGDFHLCQRRD